MVDQEHQGSADEGAGNLGDPVRHDLPPGEVAPHGEAQRDGGVEVRPADAARHPYAERDGPRPPEHDQQPVAGRQEDRGRRGGASGAGERGHGHGHTAITEGEDDKGTEELRHQLAPQAADAANRAAFASCVQRLNVGHYAPLSQPQQRWWLFGYNGCFGSNG